MGISLSALGVNLDRLYHGQPATSSGTIYTAPTGKRVTVTSRVIANPSGVPLTVRLGLIPSGGSSDGTHYLLGDLAIPANDTWESDAPLILRAGDALEAQSASLPAPTGLAVTGSTTGGAIAAGTYYYRITATNGNGETLPNVSGTVVANTGATSSNALSWNRVLGATGYKVYRGTTQGSETLLDTVTGGSTTAYTDNGSKTPSGALPSTGTAAGCIFSIFGAEIAN